MITHKIEGDKAVLKKMDDLVDPALRRAIMDEIGSYGVSSTQQRFIDEKDAEGNSWEKSYRAKTKGGSTLRDGNYLFQSLTHAFGSKFTAWGSNKIYAAIHHFGGVIKPKHKEFLKFTIGGTTFFAKKVEMPARPYLGLSDDDRSEIDHIIRDHFMTEISQ